MSTKTIYKRIALVAVATLGAGLLSVAPASADLVAQVNTSVTSLSLATVTSSPVVGAAVAVNLGAATAAQTPGADDTTSAAFTGFLSAYPASGFVQVSAAATATGTTTLLTNTANTISGSTLTATSAVAATATFGNTVAASAALGIGSFSFTPTVAGTYTLQVFNDANKDGIINVGEAVQTVNITVAAASGYSSALSTMHSITGAGGVAADATTNAVALVAPRTLADTTRAAITVTLRNAANAVMTSGNTLTAVMSGVGGLGSTVVTANTPGAADCSATVVARVKTLAADDVNTFTLCSDGNSGVGTVTISVTDATGTTTVLGTKTITFYGTVATLSATVLQGIATPGVANGNNTTNAATQATLALTPAVVVVAKDSNGIVVPALTVTGKPADLTIVASSTTAGAVNGTTDKNGPGWYNFNVTGGAAANVGKSTTIVYSTIVSATLTISAPAVTVSLGGTPAAVTWALDAANYTPGAKVVITVTAKDAAGNPAADGTYGNLFAGATSLSGAVTGSTPGASVELVGGSKAYTAFAPGTTGSYEISNTLAASAGASSGTKLAAAIVVENPEALAATDAANEATDAANAATDAALAAADAADAATAAAQDAADAVAALSTRVSTLVSDLRKQISALTKLVKRLL